MEERNSNQKLLSKVEDSFIQPNIRKYNSVLEIVWKKNCKRSAVLILIFNVFMKYVTSV